MTVKRKCPVCLCAWTSFDRSPSLTFIVLLSDTADTSSKLDYDFFQSDANPNPGSRSADLLEQDLGMLGLSGGGPTSQR